MSENGFTAHEQPLNFMATWCINSEKNICKNDFPYQFKKIIVHCKKIGYSIEVLRQTVCLVVNTIRVKDIIHVYWVP